MGDGIKKPVRNEERTKKFVRRSLVAAKEIRTGDILSLNDIAIKRPGTGIPPEFMEIVVGMKAKRDIRVDSVLEWEDLKNA